MTEDDDDDDCGALGGIRIGRGTEVVKENLPQCHYVHHKSHMTSPGFKPSRRGGKPATNRQSYGTAEINWILLVRFGSEIWSDPLFFVLLRLLFPRCGILKPV
jgi:hypothetical protein